MLIHPIMPAIHDLALTMRNVNSPPQVHHRGRPLQEVP
jgi:hypothetical protein